jgi:hypothetical protein
MITEQRGSHERSTGHIEVELTVSVTRDEATAISWYVGGPIELALQRIVKDRITRAVDAYGNSEFTNGAPSRRH